MYLLSITPSDLTASLPSRTRTLFSKIPTSSFNPKISFPSSHSKSFTGKAPLRCLLSASPIPSKNSNFGSQIPKPTITFQSSAVIVMRGAETDAMGLLLRESIVFLGSSIINSPGDSRRFLNGKDRCWESFALASGQHGLTRGTAEKKPAKSDPIYCNRLVNMLVNRIMKRGKKSLAYQIIYQALKKIQKKQTNPLSILRQAILGVTPNVIVKTIRTRISTKRVPIEIGSSRGKVLAVRWLLEESRKRPGRSMAFKLSSEIMDAAKGIGGAIKKKEDTQKDAEKNRTSAWDWRCHKEKGRYSKRCREK